MTKRLIILVLLSCSVARAQFARSTPDFSLQNAQGQAIAGASVYVLTQPADTSKLLPLATIYGSPTGSGAAVCGATAGQLTNPLKTDGFGHACAYAAPGLYTVCYVSSQINPSPLCYQDQLFPNTSGGGGGGAIPTYLATYGTDACASILNLITTAGVGTVGGAIQFYGPFTTLPCAYNAAGAAPFGAFAYNQTTHATIGPSFYLNLGSVAIQSDVQWVNVFKSTIFGNAMISGLVGGTTILASNNFVPWFHNGVVNGTAPLLTITGATAINAGGNSASYPFGLTGGNWIKIVGTGTCLDNAWRVDSSTASSITIYYVQPGSGCTPPTLPVTVNKIYVPLVVNGNSSAGGGVPGYGSVDAGAFIYDLAIDCNPQGAANAPHPQNCQALAGYTWNEGSGIENVDLKNTTSIGLDIEVPSLSSTGATGHPADYFVRNVNILVDPFYTNNPTTNVDPSICEYVNTHGNPFWYDLGGTCKVVSGGTEAADAIQVIGTQGGTLEGKHIEGFQHCVHFIAPTAPETSLNHAIKVLNESCSVFNTTAMPANILIDAGSGFPIDIDTVTGIPAGGAIVSDNQSGFNTANPGGDTVDGFLNHYSSVGAGFWRIDSGSFSSTINGGGDSWYASSGGGALTLGNNNNGTLTNYAIMRSVSSGFVLSNENAGGGPIFIRPTGTNNATPQFRIDSAGLQMFATGASFSFQLANTSALTAMRTWTPLDLNGSPVLQPNTTLITSTGTCFNNAGQVVGCATTTISGPTGTAISNGHTVFWTGALTAGALTINLSGGAQYTSATTYFCSSNDSTTPTNSVTVTQVDGVHFTLAGTGTDSVRGACTGN